MHQLDHIATVGLGAVVDALRDERKLSVRGLATTARIPRTSLDRSLEGIRAFPVNELFRVAEALGTTPDDLIAAARAAA
jgi:Helix-turn-helix